MIILQTIFAFIFTIGILVAIHEFGHYYVAKRLGVKILCFSIGFGKPLWSRTFGKDKTEFRIAAIPLGGYVKMLGEQDDEVKSEEQHRAFNQQPLWAKSAIVAAGPLINLLFAVIIYALMFMVGVSGSKPIIGEVNQDSLAAYAGFQSGYEIVEVDNKITKRWQSVSQASLQAVINNQELVNYKIADKNGNTKTLLLNLSSITADDFSKHLFFDKLGFRPFMVPIPTVIDHVEIGSVADKAGLISGDKVLSVDNIKIDDWRVLANYISKHAGKEVTFFIKRDSKEFSVKIIPKDDDGRRLLGFMARLPENWPPAKYKAFEQYGLFTSLYKGAEETWKYSKLTLQMMGKMLTLEVSSENISGPITIAKYAGQSLSFGLDKFLFFLGLVSLSLGVMNLLPIPILDGGHLFVYFIEAIKGSPLSDNSLFFMQRVGMVLLFMLMSLAIFNDINRFIF
jgi:regulator of sigma E protease